MVPLLVFVQFLVAVNSQYLSLPEYKPDVTFGDHNDRFDVRSLIQYQNQFLKADSMSRRSNRYHTRKGRWIVLDEKGDQEVLDNLKNTFMNELDEIGKLASSNWVSGHDIYPVDQEKEDNTNFEMSVDDLGARRSLNDVFIKLAGGRRMGKNFMLPNGKKETRLDYAVPIEMIVNGYLVLPTDV